MPDNSGRTAAGQQCRLFSPRPPVIHAALQAIDRGKNRRNDISRNCGTMTARTKYRRACRIRAEEPMFVQKETSG